MKIDKAVRIGKRYINPVPTSVGTPSMMFKVLWRYLTNKAERTPKHKLGPFHTDLKIYQNSPVSGLRVTWMGHSSMLVEIDGTRILIDPVWDQRAAPVQWAGPKRFFDPPLKLEDLPPIDIILLSHDHYDHLGARTVKQLAQMEAMTSTQWIMPLGVGAVLRKLGAAPKSLTELNWAESKAVGPLKITALPARHFSGRSITNRFETLWASFVLAAPNHRIYYGADSGEWEGFTEIGQEYGPFDLTMLEIGAFDPLWADIHMGPDGAIRTFQALGGTGLLMPIHWGLFDLALHAWRQPIDRIFELTELGAAENVKLWAPEPGASTEVEPGVEVRSTWWQPAN
jgi:L-ascorbate metabolism protein UlaG (beta-lactamase superfamily)